MDIMHVSGSEKWRSYSLQSFVFCENANKAFNCWISPRNCGHMLLLSRLFSINESRLRTISRRTTEQSDAGIFLAGTGAARHTHTQNWMLTHDTRATGCNIVTFPPPRPPLLKDIRGHTASWTDTWERHAVSSPRIWHHFYIRATYCNSRGLFNAERAGTNSVGGLVSIQLRSTWKDKLAPGLIQCWLESGGVPTCTRHSWRDPLLQKGKLAITNFSTRSSALLFPRDFRLNSQNNPEAPICLVCLDTRLVDTQARGHDVMRHR